VLARATKTFAAALLDALCENAPPVVARLRDGSLNLAELEDAVQTVLRFARVLLTASEGAAAAWCGALVSAGLVPALASVYDRLAPSVAARVACARALTTVLSALPPSRYVAAGLALVAAAAGSPTIDESGPGLCPGSLAAACQIVGGVSHRVRAAAGADPTVDTDAAIDVAESLERLGDEAEHGFALTSGAGGGGVWDDDDNNNNSNSNSNSNSHHHGASSFSTAATSSSSSSTFSSSSSSSSAGGGAAGGAGGDSVGAADPACVAQVCDMLPDLPAAAVRRALASYDNNVERAIDALLTQGAAAFEDGPEEKNLQQQQQQQQEQQLNSADSVAPPAAAHVPAPRRGIYDNAPLQPLHNKHDVSVFFVFFFSCVLQYFLLILMFYMTIFPGRFHRTPTTC
jgi:uncharacterized membrane protein YgcG